MRRGHRSAAQLLIVPVWEGANNRNSGRAQVHRMAPIVGEPGQLVPAVRRCHRDHIRQIVNRRVNAIDIVVAAVAIDVAIPGGGNEQNAELHLRFDGVM